MNGTAARRAPSPARVSAPPSMAQCSATADATSPGGWSSGADNLALRANSRRLRIGLLRQFAYVAIDVAMVMVGGALLDLALSRLHVLAAWAPSFAQLHAKTSTLSPSFLLLHAALIVLACKSQHLYRTPKELTAMEETFMVAKAVGVATALLVLFILTSDNREVPRTAVACAGALNMFTLAGWRYAKRRYVLHRAMQGASACRVLIIGNSKSAQAFSSWLEANRYLGYSVRGLLATEDGEASGHHGPFSKADSAGVLGSLQDLRRIALEEFIDQLFIALPADREIVKQIFLEAQRLRLVLNVVPDIYDGLGWHAPIHSIGGFPVLELLGQTIPAFGLAAKRTVDIALGSLLFLLAAPIIAIAAVAIPFDSPGPILYAAQRMGKKGKKFRCYKLRTMVHDADDRKPILRSTENQRNGPFFKIANDPRITRIGVWLRRFSIDELPQLINVIRGDMSLVGPRPHPLDDVEGYGVEDLRRLDVKPGLTGLWQVAARRDPSFETSMHCDLQYIENWSLYLDVKILLETVFAVLRGEGT
jgi:exopolysaccharide biosynthesis polyprenyl glycosylphosphotransferase